MIFLVLPWSMTSVGFSRCVVFMKSQLPWALWLQACRFCCFIVEDNPPESGEGEALSGPGGRRSDW